MGYHVEVLLSPCIFLESKSTPYYFGKFINVASLMADAQKHWYFGIGVVSEVEECHVLVIWVMTLRIAIASPWVRFREFAVLHSASPGNFHSVLHCWFLPAFIVLNNAFHRNIRADVSSLGKQLSSFWGNIDIVLIKARIFQKIESGLVFYNL